MAGALVLRPANVEALWHLAGMQLAGEPLLNVSATCGLRLTGTDCPEGQAGGISGAIATVFYQPSNWTSLTLHSLSHSSLVT